MREILFRGKRKDNGEWVEGHNIMCVQDGRVFIVPTGTKIDSYREEDNALFMATFYYEVIPETVGQYTGLTDKNGKKIFEGDIVRHYNNQDDPEKFDVGCIYFDVANYCFVRNSGHYTGPFKLSGECIYEVIGNVTDNPELLEVHNVTENRDSL